MPNPIEHAISELRLRGHRVEETTTWDAPIPKLYRVDDGPELTEMQVMRCAAEAMAGYYG